MSKLHLEITMGEDHKLFLSADNMNELVDKIIEWSDWETNKDFLPKNPELNWYYYKVEDVKLSA